jgi:hypothetical protein
MKKIKLNFTEFKNNSGSISDFLSKKSMGQITGGSGSTLPSVPDPLPKDGTSVVSYNKIAPIPYTKSSK